MMSSIRESEVAEGDGLNSNQKKEIKRLKKTSKNPVNILLPMFDEKGKQISGTLISHLKKGLPYLTNPDNVKDTKAFLIRKRKDLKIYLINGHSYGRAGLILRPPKGEKQFTGIITKEYIAQINSKWEIERADESLDVPDDFLTAGRGVFIVGTTPIGYDSRCSDTNLVNFLIGHKMQDNFSSLRDTLMSEDFTTLFTQPDPGAFTFFTPPGTVAPNTLFSFCDEEGDDTSEKYGVMDLTITDVRSLLNWSNTDFEKQNKIKDLVEKQISRLNPATDMRLKKIIEDSIRNDTSVSLKTITETCGPGIYLLVGCNGITISMWDGYREVFDNYGPDTENHFNQIQPIYSSVMNDLEIMSRNTRLTWGNVVQEERKKLPMGREIKKQKTTIKSTFAVDSTLAGEKSMKSDGINADQHGGPAHISKSGPGIYDKDLGGNFDNPDFSGGKTRKNGKKAKKKKSRKSRKSRKSKKSKKSKKGRKSKKSRKSRKSTF